MLMPTLQVFIARNAMGTFLNSFDLGIGLGAILLGAIAAMNGYSIMYKFSIVFCILYWLLYQFFSRRKNASSSSQSDL
jgi:predicted MFS family arabinose efflux permease